MRLQSCILIGSALTIAKHIVCMLATVYCLTTKAPPRRSSSWPTCSSNIALGLENCLHMGNIDALRDWGHAKDYVRIVDDAAARGSTRLRYCDRQTVFCETSLLGPQTS